MSRPQVRAGGRSTPVVVVSPRLRSNQEEAEAWAEGTVYLNERDIMGIWGKDERAGWAASFIRTQRYMCELGDVDVARAAVTAPLGGGAHSFGVASAWEIATEMQLAGGGGEAPSSDEEGGATA